ncbi:hypothetical protein AGMMS50212_01040 [Spirochaetia bacterium]|nr:hypothetical protein AGMMS50212_01040 [Spirochaetia bacterium]
MKKIIIALFISVSMTALIFAQNKQIEEPFTGTSLEIANWINSHDKQFRSIASDVSKVIAYSGSTEALNQDNFTASFYEYKDLSKDQIGTVLELTDNKSGKVIYVVWTNEAIGDDAVFYNDPDKAQLDVSVASRGRSYGMSNDTKKYVRSLIKELK